MAESFSPLRYPGGKAVLAEFIATTIATNGIEGCTYVEPYAGGAGAAIKLLLAGKVERIVLNDADRCVWSFWYSILYHPDEFIARILSTPITVAEWRRQRAIYRARPRRILDLGFAAFFLNRCNRSGILTNGSVIGGIDQNGQWKIDARYNPDELICRILSIASLRERISVFNLDAIQFLRRVVLPEKDRTKFFIYLDPPYFVKGSRLYLNFYDAADHARLANFLRRIKNLRWLVTYDNVPEIRALYSWRDDEITDFFLQYSAAAAKEGSEIMIGSPGLELPVEELIQVPRTA